MGKPEQSLTRQNKIICQVFRRNTKGTVIFCSSLSGAVWAMLQTAPELGHYFCLQDRHKTRQSLRVPFRVANNSAGSQQQTPKARYMSTGRMRKQMARLAGNKVELKRSVLRCNKFGHAFTEDNPNTTLCKLNPICTECHPSRMKLKKNIPISALAPTNESLIVFSTPVRSHHQGDI